MSSGITDCGPGNIPHGIHAVSVVAVIRGLVILEIIFKRWWIPVGLIRLFLLFLEVKKVLLQKVLLLFNARQLLLS